MTEGTKQYDLEERAFRFAKWVRQFCKLLPRVISNIEDCRQLIRSSGSVGANYIEANEALSKKDFVLRIKISRKEAKESKHWLKLLDTNNILALEEERNRLVQEAVELTKILNAIITKSTKF